MYVQCEVVQVCTEQHTFLVVQRSKKSGARHCALRRVDIGGAPQKRKNSGGCDRTDYRIRLEGDTYP